MVKRLTTIILISFFLSILVTTLLNGIIIRLTPRDYSKMHCDMSDIAYIFGWVFNLLIAIGSTTIYLNLFERIRTNYFYSLLTFLLSPLITAIVACLMINFSFESLKFMTMILPYLGILIFQFLRFTKSQKSEP